MTTSVVPKVAEGRYPEEGSNSVSLREAAEHELIRRGQKTEEGVKRWQIIHGVVDPIWSQKPEPGRGTYQDALGAGRGVCASLGREDKLWGDRWNGRP